MLYPLPDFPIIRDLVVDMTNFFHQYLSVLPYLINVEPPQVGCVCSRRMTATS